MPLSPATMPFIKTSANNPCGKIPESQPPSFAKLHSIPSIGNCASQKIDWNMINKTEIRIT